MLALICISFFFKNSQIRNKGFKSIEYLEIDLNNLYQIEVKYLEKLLKLNSNSKGNETQMKYLDMLINQTPIGVLKKSELGQPMRLYYYLSPLDLIQHHSKDHNLNEISCKNNLLSSLSLDQIIQHELGSYVSISLQSTRSNEIVKTEPTTESSLDDSNLKYRLPDSTLLILNEKDDEKSWHDYLNPYFNANFSFEK